MRHCDVVTLIRDGLEEAMPGYTGWSTSASPGGIRVSCWGPGHCLYDVGIEIDIALVKKALRNKRSVPLVIASRQDAKVPFPVDPTVAALNHWLKHN